MQHHKTSEEYSVIKTLKMPKETIYNIRLLALFFTNRISISSQCNLVCSGKK